MIDFWSDAFSLKWNAAFVVLNFVFAFYNAFALFDLWVAGVYLSLAAFHALLFNHVSQWVVE